MTPTRYRSSIIAAWLLAAAILVAPSAASAVVCRGDRTYETAVADGCTSITGRLEIVNTTLSNIDGLSALTSVGGTLERADWRQQRTTLGTPK